VWSVFVTWQRTSAARDETRLRILKQTSLGLSRDRIYRRLSEMSLTPIAWDDWGERYIVSTLPVPIESWPASGDVEVDFQHASRQGPAGTCGANARLVFDFSHERVFKISKARRSMLASKHAGGIRRQTAESAIPKPTGFGIVQGRLRAPTAPSACHVMIPLLLRLDQTPSFPLFRKRSKAMRCAAPETPTPKSGIRARGNVAIAPILGSRRSVAARPVPTASTKSAKPTA